ncbi:STAS domain-containing protein [Vibrio fluvialis]|uniref:STAS domain-containing protein n=1 Tax=Vibrio TaxID=662 RepID=UPI0012AD2316|nr:MULTISPECIES: STAS domain-containing protein [Vibrio]EKO3375879.1 STAS domain-containing protein [Vibrio fluvialis]EKO3385688.1 STAS domain-containing protein [Vibrio fluvialis]EKO3390558.1 STAS domain-containing protein [Vibrio fluvialis]EKO3400417.1 STAS domain-containing protein [Vibrio fluvialis]EKO3404805.1 STAS domain-containing protein [Vibrio fluvialis]
MGLHTNSFNDTTLTLLFSGNLDADGSQKALPLLDKVISNPEFCEIEVDLANVTFLDSSGIGAIVYLYKRLVANNRRMRIENVSGQPLEIFTLLRIEHAIPVNSKQLTRKAS